MARGDGHERRYEGYRQAAREATADTLYKLARAGPAPRALLFGLRLTAIDDATLAAWELQWSESRFPWRRIVGQARPYIRRFEIAIWVGGDLLGLCVGRASRGPDNVTLHYVERRRGSNGLKGSVAEIATDAAETYAVIIGRRQLKLKDPVEGAVPLYRALGFELAGSYRGSTYFRRSVSP
ncbi:hypothetical protein [Methylobacterium oxalidis]|uniref:hypothetical protein n=1 Tax=Methylobacterium oxalidis TaxID=944322 RepID=UPI003315518D